MKPATPSRILIRVEVPRTGTETIPLLRPPTDRASQQLISIITEGLITLQPHGTVPLRGSGSSPLETTTRSNRPCLTPSVMSP